MWLQLSLTIDRRDAPRLSEVLSDTGALAVSLSDAADDPLYEPAPGSAPLWPSTRVSGLFAEATGIERALDALRAALAPQPLPLHSVEPLADREWTREWLTRFHPLRFGRRLWVCPLGQESELEGSIVVVMEPGLAFGTGTHPTTALCLEWLDGAALAGTELIDYGCGSGILGIAALKLGARCVWSVDNDDQAIQATHDNATRNRVAATLNTATPTSLPGLAGDILLANILLQPLLDLAERFAGLVRSGGEIVLSGLLVEQVDAVERGYSRWFELQAPVVRDEWVRLAGTRRD